MFVGVFEANVEDCGHIAPVKTFFELLFGDAFNGHGAILAVPHGIVKVAGTRLGRALLRGDVTRHEG